MNTHKLKPAIEYILTQPNNVHGVDEQLDAAWAIYDAEVTPSSVMAMISDNETLRKDREGKVLCDLELFETLRDSANSEADEHRQCMATYRPLRQASLDSVVKKCDDLLAAMSKEVLND